MQLPKKTVVILGGAGLLGSEFARVCASEGARVIIADVNDAAGVCASAYCMKSCHMGPTMNPETFFTMGVLSLFPAHIPTTKFGAYPTVHASL